MNDIVNAKEFIEKKISHGDDPRVDLFNDMVSFMEAISLNDYDTAESAIERIAHENQGELYKEVGRVTRKLHDAIRGFRDTIDPKVREIAESEMPNTVDKLQMVIEKTEEAANKTMGIVETYLVGMSALDGHLSQVQGPPESVEYLQQFRGRLEEDMINILTTQSFQDLTGQTIKKVIKQVGEIEFELVKLVATFGAQDEGKKPSPTIVAADQPPETVSQSDVDDLLKNFGF
ncbi:protein phosphatase CheZ [Methylococcus sp. EFPC2]|uniref:protein phosphatase CheZ n=1 Tax=Methylococcus sp. EFPC2 TaxID=2812648 RepID=UPI00196706CB|nr:protein phosphatase CheZ [Methylococcus sp. EFPC2]QSA98838.1 protein phosphatase CheZ [Methylococcus sp. EFPC2]